MEDGSEEDADDGDKDGDGDGGREAGDTSKTTFVHVKPVGLPLHQALELCVQSLAVKVVDRILEGIFVSLFAHTLVASSLETSALDWHTLKMVICECFECWQGVLNYSRKKFYRHTCVFS